jgi:hypothetical protein
LCFYTLNQFYKHLHDKGQYLEHSATLLLIINNWSAISLRFLKENERRKSEAPKDQELLEMGSFLTVNNSFLFGFILDKENEGN